MTDGLADLPGERLREALALLAGTAGDDVPAGRPAVLRALRRRMGEPGHLRRVLQDAPPGAAEAFARLVREGPLSVEALLGRGWWGRGLLPSPLDWLQRRAMVTVTAAGLVAAVPPAAEGWRAQQLHLATGDAAASPDEPDPDPAPVVVEAARTVVITEDMGRVLAVPGAGLKAVAATVAVSRREPRAVEQALRAAGVRLRGDEVVEARPAAPALPGSAERALTPWAIRAVLQRAVAERRQVHLEYFPSSRGGAPTERTVDPWTFADDLLVGWCHLRAGERTFALDRVGSATLLGTSLTHRPPAGTVPPADDGL